MPTTKRMQRILSEMPNEPASIRVLEKKLDIPTDSLRRTLKAMLDLGLVDREVRQNDRGKPIFFWWKTRRI
jgi:predicted ArsR family transcriptional regulator